MTGGGRSRFDRLSVVVSAKGLSHSYAIRIVAGNRSNWVLVYGLSGQLTRVKDEMQALDILRRLSPDGNDAD